MAEIKSIYSNRCWVEQKLQPATIHVSKGKIIAIDFCESPDALNVGNDILMPGVIDAHVHVNEPGRTEWEGFETATQAAAAGGTTTIVDMPLNASPVTVNVESLHLKIKSTENKLFVNVAFYGGLVPQHMSALDELLRSGISGIKCFLVHSGIDEFPNVIKADLEMAMPVIAKSNLPLLAHCEIHDETIDSGLLSDTGNYSKYLASRPKKWENEAVEMMIDLCRKFNCPVHIVHVSSAEALPLIAAAKAEGLPITAETCAHYIFFNAENIPDRATIYKCAPPIREQSNNQQLKKALVDGVLDFITTDHSPAPPSIKEITSGNLAKAWGGIAGIQFLLSASWSAMKNDISVEHFIPLLTSNPAHFLQIETKGEIKVGYDADMVVWSPEESFEVHAKDILHRYDVSPYVGKKLSGVIKQTIVNGQVVYQGKKIEKDNKFGELVLRK
jgi:allantoinase